MEEHQPVPRSIPPSVPQPARRLASVVFMNWRDSGNPEGGGSELYVERVATALAARGHRVTIFSAAYAGAPREEWRDGVRFVRRGGKLSVYARAAHAYLTGALRPHDVVVDVQNGMPFLARLYARRPVIVLVHHVHREQWPIVYGTPFAQLGWWIESRLSPAVNRGSRYVAVSAVTRDELAGLGVRAEDITVVHNGTPAPLLEAARSPEPSICVVGRLVPHKRIEHAIDAVAALRSEFPGLRLTIAGRGWWEDELRAYAGRAGVGDAVEFVGFVSEVEKHRILATSWVSAAPSVKEGWGLSVMEAASHATPSVAYRAAGGLAESIVDGHTGLLVDSGTAEFGAAVARLLRDAPLRDRLGRQARERAQMFSWDATAEAFAKVVDEVSSSRRGG